ncbi:DUF1440 domain-containing protein [Tengunoibacter tsumagoiensis]|uniref:DUF1440 domain-containing protein n=1 Tax=Tengunoibacter tsumagoiensis TaxID=2014871 RepID=A0A401ZV29_9CHLR|nr:DUF1440 domain-containing protein [Tengunoibacter tsumagoiensis]GCE10798.1 hypothetical protein KTT_06570 [Tengunoibacter tsumagoiensis]
MDRLDDSLAPMVVPLQAGTVAGFVATVPMTAFMLIMHQLLPGSQQYELPPEEIVEEIIERAEVRGSVGKPQILGISLAAHFSYGSGMGSLYSILMQKLKWPPILKGSLFGLGIWMLSYLGWLPLGRFSAAAPKESARRNLLMIIAHLIWGATTGIVADQLELYI